MISARFASVDEIAAQPIDAELTDAERARHDRLHFAADRDAYAAAHLLVRVCAADLLGVTPARVRLAQSCPRCGAAGHGRPSVVGEPGLFVSLSHTRGYVAAAAATAPCGIDVETISSHVIDRAIVGGEWAWLDAQEDRLLGFTRLWTRKEALVKAGLTDDPGSIDVLAGSRGGYGDVGFEEWIAAPVAGAPPAVGCVASLR